MAALSMWSGREARWGWFDADRDEAFTTVGRRLLQGSRDVFVCDADALDLAGIDHLLELAGIVSTCWLSTHHCWMAKMANTMAPTVY